ncbi:arsenate reductase (glutaredoxin) [Aliiglaciecola sp. LCG003]|uniref:arsenate reductase (glutaredoxin) n=1 Tax=Aliiglaciecola sp. LCG003 TaxID=3053655 RepID=UPI002574601A|nr:arsenate reductase (glutaredoxin) [Aliiglaciecola sp. LCG003]WJG11143.1 arsenate reductase (glutaredoxin) [Aliiglaciecola sp. LCG003]
MTQLEILHNPRCSKSRQTLELLKQNGHDPVVIEYLKHPLSKQQITQIIEKLSIQHPRLMMRTKEAEFSELGLNHEDTSIDAFIEAMVSHPKLIERPIVITENKARIGRPPESVLEIL